MTRRERDREGTTTQLNNKKGQNNYKKKNSKEEMRKYAINENEGKGAVTDGLGR